MTIERNQGFISPEALRRQVNAQLNKKLSMGFHLLLDKSSWEYGRDFGLALEEAIFSQQPRSELSLVDPRIPVDDQLKALGIQYDDSTSDIFPYSEKRWKPYAVWLTPIGGEGKTKQELVDELTADQDPASLAEVLGVDNISEVLYKSESIVVLHPNKPGSFVISRTQDGSMVLGYQRGHYLGEDRDSNRANLYTPRRFQKSTMLASIAA